MSDALLGVWIFCSLIWDIICVGGCTYLVFWRGHSGWWYILALAVCDSSTMYKALRKRFQVSEESAE